LIYVIKIAVSPWWELVSIDEVPQGKTQLNLPLLGGRTDSKKGERERVPRKPTLGKLAN
jgi:hypothetical protein